MGLTNVPGIGSLRDALDTTNGLLQQVLDELRRTNDESLSQIRDELRAALTITPE